MGLRSVGGVTIGNVLCILNRGSPRLLALVLEPDLKQRSVLGKL